MIWSSRDQTQGDSSRQRRALVLALWIIVLTLGMFARADAHMVPSSQIAIASVPEAEIATIAAPTEQHDDGTCPAGAGHRGHQCCIGGVGCHAMTGAVEVAALEIRGAVYQAAPSRAGAKVAAAPLFHPPKPLIDI